MFGAVFTTVVALICSLCYGFNDPTKISPDLIAPILRKRIFKSQTAKTSALATKDTEF